MGKLRTTKHDGLVLLIEVPAVVLVELVVPPACDDAIDDDLGDVSANNGDTHETLIGDYNQITSNI